MCTAFEADRSLRTTELARHLAISPATASEHLTVLRQAGLTASLRDRNSVRHTLTPLGHAMLRGHYPDAVPSAVRSLRP